VAVSEWAWLRDFVSALSSAQVCIMTPNLVSLWTTWIAGALGGLATWFVSTPTEIVKCRTQISSSLTSNSWIIDGLKYRGCFSLSLKTRRYISRPSVRDS
jgi:hypothetical protein